jgi:hypothetical protein
MLTPVVFLDPCVIWMNSAHSQLQNSFCPAPPTRNFNRHSLDLWPCNICSHPQKSLVSLSLLIRLASLPTSWIGIAVAQNTFYIWNRNWGHIRTLCCNLVMTWPPLRASSNLFGPSDSHPTVLAEYRNSSSKLGCFGTYFSEFLLKINCSYQQSAVPCSWL